MKRKVAFIPEVECGPASSERTPRMLYLLSLSFQSVPIRLRRSDRRAFDQSSGRFERYAMFAVNEALIFWDTLRAGRREKVSLVFAEGSYYSLAGGRAARILGVPMVWDNHGNIVDFSKTMGKSRLFASGNLVMERLVARMASCVLVVSEKERKSYEALGFDASKLCVVPTCADMASVRQRALPRDEARRRLGMDPGEKAVLFFGALRYMPNRDAARYLVEEMMPSLRASVPNARLYIAGSGGIGMDAPDDVTMLGFVDDLHLWISAADVCVAPMWKGVGILTKVIDIMSVGRPAVVSPLALEGIPELEHGANCLVGASREEFAARVAEALRDEGGSEELGRRGRELMESRYSWEVHAPLLIQRLESLMARDRQVQERPAPKAPSGES